MRSAQAGGVASRRCAHVIEIPTAEEPYNTTIKNTDTVDGADVAQVYVHQQYSTLPRPEKELKGFQKVFLKAGESKTISIKLNEDAFQYYNDQLNQWVMEPGKFDVLVGNSSKNILLKETVQL